MTFSLEIIYYFKIVEVHKNSRRKKKKKNEHVMTCVASGSVFVADHGAHHTDVEA